MMKTRSVVSSALAIAASLLWASVGVAQQGTITGTVERSTGEPVSGARVTIEGTDLGTVVDQEGRFSLSVPPGRYQVRANALGFAQATRTVTVEAGGSVGVRLVMSPKAIDLGQVVVSLEATEARRVELGTDRETIDTEEIEDQAAPGSFTDLINARATGVSISQSSGEVGTAQQIRIRGTTSITQDNNPIVYVDGVRVSNATGTGPGSSDFGDGQTISRLDDINPSDIVSVEVLKGPTAAAQYGSEAAAGVLLISTKSGTTDRTRITVTTEQGWRSEKTGYPDNYFNVTDNGGFTDPSAEVLQQWRPVPNPVTGDVFARHNPLENPLTSPFKTGRIANWAASIRGGADPVTYYGSLDWDQESGSLANNWLQRKSFRVNASADPSDDLNVSLSSSFIDSDIRLPDNDRSSLAIHGNGLSGIPVTSYGTLPDGSRGDCLATVALGQPESVCATKKGNQHNTFEKLMTVWNEQEMSRAIASLSAQWRPLDVLTARATAGVDYRDERNFNRIPRDPDRPFGTDSRGFIDDRRTSSTIFTADLSSTLSLDVTDRLTSTTTGGAQLFTQDEDFIRCVGRQFASEDADACDAALLFDGFSSRVESVEGGVFMMQRFGWNEYLYGQAALRLDDNSAFGAEQDPIWSPSANVSALISDMPFWNVDFVSELRLRFAWGKAAQAPGPFAASRTFRPVRLEEEGDQISGISPLDPGNPELTAERNEEFEVGFDAGLLDDRVGLKVTYYDQQTTDAILSTEVAPSTGFTGEKFVNIGKVENHGFEAVVDALALNMDDLQWNLTFNFSTQNAVVADLGDQAPIMFGLGPDFQMIREGYSPGHLWGRPVAEAERAEDGSIVPGSVVLASGTVDDPNFPNQVALGRANPQNEQSLSTTITLFDDIRIYSLVERAGGFVKYDLSGNFSTARHTTRDWAFRQVDLTPEEQAMVERGFVGAIPYFISDGDFIKWREATIQYDLPESVLDLAGGLFERAALTFGVRNIATITDYQGLDPESNFNGGADELGVGEFRNAPPLRHFFGKLRVSW